MTSEKVIQHAVIYCRVSSSKQKKEGHGLASQESRCREYAKYKNYIVSEVFYEEAVSGGITERPSMQLLHTFLRKHRKTPHAVIIDDISRLARSLEVHLILRASIERAGGTLESPSIEFGDDPDARLVEHMLASVSQHFRQKNTEQTRNRMRARLLNGYWVFSQTPPGYKMQKVEGHGKLLVRDEPLASIIAEGLEGFASGRFASQGELKRFLEKQPEFPKDLPKGEIRYETVARLLQRVHYSGYIEYKKWNVSLRKGHHEGLISLETWQKIQNLIKAGARVPARKDINADFPLRGFINCGDCDRPLTACWSKGGSGNKHPYYLCHNKTCQSYRKSIRRDRIEGEFETLLKQISPAKSITQVFQAMFKKAWNKRLARTNNQSRTLKQEIKEIETLVQHCVDRIIESSTPTAIAAFETRIAQLEADKLVLMEKLEKGTGPRETFEEMFERAFTFLSSPWNFWFSDRLEHKRTVLKLAFADNLTYHRNQGFRTPKTALPFSMLGGMKPNFCEEVTPTGFEPVWEHSQMFLQMPHR